jgi:hypothetical protein
LRDSHILTITAVGISSGCLEIGAQVLISCQTEFAFPTCGINPRNPNSVSNFMESDVFTNLFYISNNLVTGYNWKVGWWGSTLDFIQFGMADTGISVISKGVMFSFRL